MHAPRPAYRYIAGSQSRCRVRASRHGRPAGSSGGPWLCACRSSGQAPRCGRRRRSDRSSAPRRRSLRRREPREHAGRDGVWSVIGIAIRIGEILCFVPDHIRAHRTQFAQHARHIARGKRVLYAPDDCNIFRRHHAPPAPKGRSFGKWPVEINLSSGQGCNSENALPAAIFLKSPSCRMADFPAFAGEEDRARDGFLAVGIIGHHAPRDAEC